MERIREAIDKARKERQGAIGQAADTTIEAGQAKPASRNVASKLDIRYTQTRQVEPSGELLRDNRVIAGVRDDERVEPYLQLRTQVLKKLRDNNWTTLAITSPNDNAGKTHVAVNLAIALAQEVNQTVLLVDLDLRDPDVHATLGLDTELGLVDYLEGKSELGEILVNPGYDRLVVLPCTPQGAYSSEVLSSPQMLDLHNELVSRYESRIIIYDLPALLRNDDALVYTPIVDATLMVVEDGATSDDDLARAMQLLEGNNLIGTVLNKVR
jgi:capsular exopolysaccharide synthesis family protein